MITPRELVRAAMRREVTGRIPVVPNLTRDMATRVYADEGGGDWLDAYQMCLENPPSHTICSYGWCVKPGVTDSGSSHALSPAPLSGAATG